MNNFILKEDQPLFLISYDQGCIDCLTEFIDTFKHGKVIGSFVGVCNERLGSEVIVLVYRDFTMKKYTGYNGNCNGVNPCFNENNINTLFQKYIDYKDEQLKTYRKSLRYPYKLEYSKVISDSVVDKVIYDLKYGTPNFDQRIVISSNKNMGALCTEYDDKNSNVTYYMDKDSCDMAQFIYSNLSRDDIDLLKKYDRDYLLKNAEEVIPLIVEIKRLCDIS